MNESGYGFFVWKEENMEEGNIKIEVEKTDTIPMDHRLDLAIIPFAPEQSNGKLLDT